VYSIGHAVLLYYGRGVRRAVKVEGTGPSAWGDDSPHLGFRPGSLAIPAQGTSKLSSAEDMSLVTASPAASPAEPRPEEFAVEPEEAEAPPLNLAPTLKTNMVAREVRVTASGAPRDKSAGERELFTEETTSVLVCENGGVIRLSAAVAPGQLLLLTNVETKSEVVAQVKRKRVYRPTSCYVELEFAEAAPRFWGMQFSAASALLPKHAEDAKAAALVISAEATADEPGEPPAAPRAEEVQEFKREVETLQCQAQLVPTPTTNQEPPAAATIAVPEAAATVAVDAPSAEPEAGSASAAGAFTEKSLPIEHHRGVMELAAAVEQAQLPTPSLDFSKSLPKARRSLRARGSFTPNFRGGVLRLALLTTALLVTAVGAAWYKHWIPWKTATRKPSVTEVANERSNLRDAKVASDAPVTSAGLPSKSAALPNTVPPEPNNAPELAVQPGAPNNSVPRPAIRKTSPTTSPAGNRSTDRPAVRAAAESVPPGTAESIMVPPKLIKSVRAVASLDAVRDFETGNVVIDAVVGSAGEVNFISVLSGPPSLRAPAVEALKQYQYEPATRNGQPVPAHVTITIHFRFEP
jgi:TonB family protein